MKYLSRIISIIYLLSTVLATISASFVNYNDYNYILDQIDQLDYDDSSFDKREDSNNTRVDQFVSLFKTIGASNIIPDILLDISSSEEKLNNLGNNTMTLLNLLQSSGGESVNTTFEGINIELNTTEILNAVMDSGIIQSTAKGLLLDDQNNKDLAKFVGERLANPDNVWIGWLLYGLGDGHDLTWSWLANVIVNTTSRANTDSSNQSEINTDHADLTVIGFPESDNSTQNTKREFEQLRKTFKRADSNDPYAGSLNQFVNNVVNAVTHSSLVQSSAEDILVALNQSGIVVPTIMESLNNNPNLGALAEHIVVPVYESGILNNIDINSYFQYAKRNRILSDGLQFLLTDPTYSPGLAKLLQRMDYAGYYQYLQDNMWGVHKRNSN